MEKAALRAQIRAARLVKFQIDDKHSVTILRPNETEIPRFMRRDEGGLRLQAEIEEVCEFVVDWSGFTEADFLPPGVGASDPVPFDSDLWRDYVADRARLCKDVAERLLQIISEHDLRLREQLGNSAPTST
jgi:hypothetical protein